MSYHAYEQKLKSLMHYLKTKSAGNASDLSHKLGVSERTVMRMLDDLRLQGFNIRYCRKQRCYVIE